MQWPAGQDEPWVSGQMQRPADMDAYQPHAQLLKQKKGFEAAMRQPESA